MLTAGPLEARRRPAKLPIPDWVMGVSGRNADAAGRVGQFRTTMVGVAFRRCRSRK